ncbi:SMI1/KNR4 family protein [Haliscomenobacter hydrossis]|uniref:Cell wall assembly/cell proliferation coordinating protein, KNR4 n=1 Tax=Haliscomenobacter hydrossis (strain ATCC 27775 / DSM 1100 / LMG 10767 / O) TaxID=760192 RepID=F4L3C8_HALH1|nr:SMI1/KNR4 family protein [Haliscomenobacter hydrossis]AEE51762.1 Cell wall assembly/cell proliferation coordinating protein, KNR4 [Haliscomenobacter hydrossis DSM 1100]
MKYFTKELLGNIKRPFRMEGFPYTEIEKVERIYGTRFPEAYREFLNLMGMRVDFFTGIDYSMYDLKLYKGGAESYLYSNFGDIGLTLLKEDDIVFVSSQGCNHFYMSTSEGENPPVHFINEGLLKLEPTQSYESFTKFIRKIGNI